MLTTEEKRAEKNAKRFWVSLVVGLLGLQLVIGGFSIHLATSDPTVAVIPDYYNASLNWDASQQQRAAAERLGWTLQLNMSDVVDAKGLRAVELKVFDAQQRPVDGLNVKCQYYHHARAGVQKMIDLQSVGDGRYLTLAAMREEGLWQIDLSITGAELPMRLSRTFIADAS